MKDSAQTSLKKQIPSCQFMNYGGVDVSHTRVTEHKHFSAWEDHEKPCNIASIHA